jgi:hypothetical protein
LARVYGWQVHRDDQDASMPDDHQFFRDFFGE